MERLEDYVRYARHIVLEYTGREPLSAVGVDLDAQVQADLGRMVHIFLEACRNPVTLPFNAKDVLAVASSKTAYKDEKLRKRFSGTDGAVYPPVRECPAVFLDSEEKIVGWYLPELFSDHISDTVLNSTTRLGSQPKTILQMGKKKNNWRTDPESFADPSRCTVTPGHAVLSPLWYELAYQFDSIAIRQSEGGGIVGWYLPELFSDHISDTVLNSTTRLGSQPKTILQMGKKKNNWRTDPESFADPSRCTVTPGHAVLSPLWYELGHDHTNSTPSPSANLRAEGGGAIEFLAEQEHTNALIGTVLALIHPELYDMQANVISRIGTHKLKVNHEDTMRKALEHWPSPFTGFAVISNRESPFHRDTKGGKELYDIVATFGRYQGGRFQVPLFGYKFDYKPGSVIALPGFLFEHGASTVFGDRVCFASFLKPTVGFGVKPDYEEVGLPTCRYLSDRFGLEFCD